MAAGPAYRIVTSRLVVRAWEPRDAPLLKAAIDESLDHLRPWMPWAKDEPQTVDEKIALLRRFRGWFDLGTDFVYGVFTEDESRVVGGSGLHTRRGEHAREIGYWVTAADEGKGFASETVAALTRVAFEIDRVERVEIHVDPRNEHSLRIPQRLGYTKEATLRGRLRDQNGQPRDAIVFSLFGDAYPTTTCARAELEAYDAGGRQLLLNETSLP